MTHFIFKESKLVKKVNRESFKKRRKWYLRIEVMEKYEFYKKNPNDKIWWVDDDECVGRHPFSFDKKKIYFFFADYPHNMTAEEVEVFDRENSFLANFFKSRKKQKVRSGHLELILTKGDE